MGNTSANEMMNQMTMGMDPSAAGGMPGQPWEWGNLFKAEKQNFDILTHKFVLEDVEEWILKLHKKKK